jgi:1-acyl-sn-glycerol-3-phosphate acyltransferase
MDLPLKGSINLMIIVFVIDAKDSTAHGVPASARKLQALLIAAGHEVRVVSCGSTEGTYRVRRRWLSYISFRAKKHGVYYGKPDEKVLREAYQGADLVHLMLPFSLEIKAEEIARRTEIPVISSFATDAVGLLRLAGLGWMRGLSALVYKLYQCEFYHKSKNIICHSQAIADVLRLNFYEQKLHVIEEIDMEKPKTVHKLERIYQQAIDDDMILYADKSRQIFKRNWAILPSCVDVSDPYKKKSLFFRGWCTWTYIWFVGLMAFVNYILFGFRVEGREHLRALKTGAVSVSNHIHNVDCTMVSAALIPSRTTFTSIPGNFRLPFVRWILKWLGVVPIPPGRSALLDFSDQTVDQLKTGLRFHFYPEGSLWQYDTSLRPFKKGAFHMAVNAGVPVLPIVLVQRPVTGFRRIFRRKSQFKGVICEPVYPDVSLPKIKQIEDLLARTHLAMCKALYLDSQSLSFQPEYSSGITNELEVAGILAE